MREQRARRVLIHVTIGIVMALGGSRLSWGAPIDTAQLLGASQDTKSWLFPELICIDAFAI
jgi:hypothetical protein